MPELPVVFENPRFDKATPTLWPVANRALRAGAIVMFEWGTLTTIEDAPRYLKFATIVIAVLVLAVHESWPWLRMRDWRWYPGLMGLLVISFLGICGYALFFEPQRTGSLPVPPSNSTQTAAPPPNNTLFNQIRLERDDLKQQLQRALLPKTAILGLDDAKNWQLMKALKNSMPGGNVCNIVLEYMPERPANYQKSMQIWSEIQPIFQYAGWNTTQSNIRTFFPPGITIFAPDNAGAITCSNHLKEFLDGLNITPNAVRPHETTPVLQACQGTCVEVSLGLLETP